MAGFLEVSIEDKLSPDLLQKAAGLPRLMEGALDEGTDILEHQAGREEGKIAASPIPRSPTGRALWTRKGELARSRRRQKRPMQRILLWQAKHARPRFALGYERMPKNPAGGIIRRNNVPKDTVEKALPQAIAAIEQHIENGLGN